MQPTEFQRFKSIMAGMGRMFGTDMDGVILDAYWLALKSWPIDEFEAAAGHLMATAEFMPKPAAFTNLRKAGQPTPAEAFAKARQILRTLNPREFIGHNSGDAKLDLALRSVGGYEALGMCTTENIGYFERRFAEAYEGISDAEATRQAVPRIAGTSRLTGPTSFAALASRAAVPVVRQ
jgi:hypothetical protein